MPFKVASIALKKCYLATRFIETEVGKLPLPVGSQFPLVDHGVTNYALLCQLHTQFNKARGKVYSGDMGEVACQFECRPPRGTAQIQRLHSRFIAHGLNGKLRQRLRKIRYTEIFVAIMELSIFRELLVGFVKG